MSCEEFLKQFREALEGKVSEQIIQDNVNYYRSYINDQAANGKSESEVLRMLGDPRLLAKTIEESSKFVSGGQSSSSNNYGSYSTSQSSDDEYAESDDKKHMKFFGWMIAIIVFVVILFALMVIFRVFVFFAPVIIAFMIGGFLYRIIRNWINGY